MRSTSDSTERNQDTRTNSALNYAYGVLEGECRRAINAVGLEPSVGFSHDFSNYQTKQPLVYDLQEPFRWLSDISVIEAFESEALKLSDFYFTGDDYRYRFEAGAKQRYINMIRECFNAGAHHKGRVLKWDTVIEKEVLGLSRFLMGKSSRLDFNEASPSLQRSDNSKLRERIRSLTAEEAKRAGIGKSTLYTLRQHVRNNRSFKLYPKVSRRLGSLEPSMSRVLDNGQ